MGGRDHVSKFINIIYRYISGENEGQQTIEMTVPVMNRMVETQVIGPTIVKISTTAAV